MEDDKLPSFIGLWWVHLVMLLVGTGLIARDRKSGAFVRRLFLRPDDKPSDTAKQGEQ
jgi:lipopolysaccharide export system permease protein